MKSTTFFAASALFLFSAACGMQFDKPKDNSADILNPSEITHLSGVSIKSIETELDKNRPVVPPLQLPIINPNSANQEPVVANDGTNGDVSEREAFKNKFMNVIPAIFKLVIKDKLKINTSRIFKFLGVNSPN